MSPPHSSQLLAFWLLGWVFVFVGPLLLFLLVLSFTREALVYVAAAVLPSVLLCSKCRPVQQSGQAAAGLASAAAAAAGPCAGSRKAPAGSPQTPLTGSDSAVDPLVDRNQLSQGHLVACSPCDSHCLNNTAQQCPSYTNAAAAVDQPRKAPEAAQVACGAAHMRSSSAESAPPCTASCCTGSCPWHLPMTLSLNLWAQDVSSSKAGSRNCSTSSRRTSGSGLSASFSGELPGSQLLPAQHTPADAFSFAPLGCAAAQHMPAHGHASTQHACAAGASTVQDAPCALPMPPAGQALFRFLSAPAAAATATADEGIISCLADLPTALSDPAGVQQHVRDTARQRAQATTGLRKLSTAGPAKQDKAAQARQVTADQHVGTAVGQHTREAPVECIRSAAAAAASQVPQQGSRLSSLRLRAPQQQTAHAAAAAEPATPPGQLLPSLGLGLHESTLHREQQDCLMQHQQEQGLDQEQHPAAYSCIPEHCQQQQGHRGPVSPLSFVATSSRHTMCMRHPCCRLHFAGGCPGSCSPCCNGFAAGAPPLPSPAESPLARRLSERDEAGLPTSPVLAELLSGSPSNCSSSSRRHLQRGFSLDSRRSLSSPGGRYCHPAFGLQQQNEVQEQGDCGQEQQQQQAVPWAGVQLRSVAQLLEQRQQRQHNPEADCIPWVARRQLLRRHTFGSNRELSVAADGAAAAAAAAVDDDEAAAADAGAAGSSSSSPSEAEASPTRQQQRRRQRLPRSSSRGSPDVDFDAMVRASLASRAAAGGALHRLSCSSAGAPCFAPAAAAADATVSVVCGPGPQVALAVRPHKELVALQAFYDSSGTLGYGCALEA